MPTRSRLPGGSPHARTRTCLCWNAVSVIFKPRRLRQEIVVDDARRMSEFFARTSGGGGWRIAIVDSADELNTEAANALLKLVEEPPDKALILLLSHRPGGCCGRSSRAAGACRFRRWRKPMC